MGLSKEHLDDIEYLRDALVNPVVTSSRALTISLLRAERLVDAIDTLMSENERSLFAITIMRGGLNTILDSLEYQATARLEDLTTEPTSTSNAKE